MDWIEHEKVLAAGVFALVDEAHTETVRGIALAMDFLAADFAEIEAEIRIESQRGAANQVRIANMQAIKGYIQHVIAKFGRLEFIYHGHMVVEDDYGNPSVVDRPVEFSNLDVEALLAKMGPEEADGISTTRAELDKLPLETREEAIAAVSKSRQKRFEAQGVVEEPPLVVHSTSSPGITPNLPLPDLTAAVNPSKRSKAGPTIIVDRAEGTIGELHGE